MTVLYFIFHVEPSSPERSVGALGEKTAVIVQTVPLWTLPNGVQACALYRVQPAFFLLRKKDRGKGRKVQL